ncbi:predicted protein [Botrytis cinerea T4]|uniref:Uncharacterized protein n=1 Tax=Botryotinia fuckeliana (strain T4) TaxID=999810 RepID=G2Y382_BOTF4|nr:predicted protein [Botrytis cinerea T4]
MLIAIARHFFLSAAKSPHRQTKNKEPILIIDPKTDARLPRLADQRVPSNILERKMDSLYLVSYEVHHAQLSIGSEETEKYVW